MNVYVETNFVHELTFLQEQSPSCERILTLCETGDANLIIPAFSLAEPLEKLHRQKNKRIEIQKSLNGEITQLSRTSGYEAKIKSIKDLDLLFAQSIDEERKRFEKYRLRILNLANVIALDSQIFRAAEPLETSLGLSTPDALVYASVLSHLSQSSGDPSCFLNRNSKDFYISEIKDELGRHKCRLIPSFDDGLRFISAAPRMN